MLLIRSILHMAWLLITVIPWGLTLVLISLWVRRTTLWWFAVNWFRLVIWGTRVFLGVRVRVRGLEHLPAGASTPAILLSKHQSTLETLLIPTLMPRPLAFVFKRELLRIPFFGWSMARLDMIHIDRESRALAMKHVIEQGKRRLAQGTWVIMFPEGTRIARGQTGTYQTAGTRLAVETGAPVVPIAVSSGKCWPRQGFIKYPGVVDVSIGPAIASVGREPKELMREVQAWIEAEMRRIDPEAYL
ncbi:1-acyl-sn-glycerol-3-phosphate acyltransferase [Rhodoferax ferrireducens T118]|uniref:1-acyl-sn-glycerol-3-phosphate acyltransferase n=1 Tax=Albidiferax ferrireducens (strain ATCC BAA-621 / DSM 15236 / T118) TaxID=338969 RepID=Q21S60_ALBFT|nr:lysophospholipid acyltransferase family protein [Rhodoferax ferrireducens]ABD71393.1 1-acyl-sn-glycerol-3-phosphate acyltransferase [Rhodoferax ferrireducens T118]WPC66475.1 lysophospholipid acyltransferase family protein [Rhodoferax ferrireducens]